MPPEALPDYEASRPTKVTMRPAVVCWLDALGLREKLAAAAKAGGEAEFVASYLRALRPIYRSIEWDFQGSDFRWNAFTDTIVLSARADRGHPEFILGNIAMAASEIQFRLIRSGWFVRGAIAFGPLWTSRQLVIGNGLLHAYKLETQEAMWPRVILDEATRDALPTFLEYYGEPKRSPQNDEFAVDEDGQIFLNYLFTPIGLDATRTKVDELLKVHRARIIQELQANPAPSALRAKFLWSAAYHNWFCASWLAGRTRRSLQISGVAPRGFRRLVD